MENVTIYPKPLRGNIKVPPSKSLAHRAVICAGLAEGESNIDNIVLSEDIKSTSNAMKSLGVQVIECNDFKEVGLKIKGTDKLNVLNNVIDCNESGSTLRFLIPITLLTEKEIVFTGRGKLVSRPLDVYYDIFKEQGIEYKNNNGELPLKVKGRLKAGNFKAAGNISSQFISGLMFTLPLLKEDSRIEITSNLESKGYVDLTMDMLRKFGINIENENYKEFYIKGNQKYTRREYRVEGDFSQAAFWLVAGVLGEEIKCEDLNYQSLQGDKVIIDILNKMKANMRVDKEYIECKNSVTEGVVIDASECPDLVPILTVLASLSKGTTKIINAKRLRIKECDRLMAIASELNKIGGEVIELEDGLIIHGKESLNGGKVDSWNDHRIAMAMAVASIKCKKPLVINNSEAVNKSYPQFWDDFKKLGGQIEKWGAS